MKTATMIAKNLRLLLRSRETAYTIVAGPLLIILLVSFAFLGSTDEYTIDVGVTAPQGSAIGERTIDSLNSHGYRVSVYPDETSCIEAIKNAQTHACIAFHAQETDNGAIPVRFHVDESRMNLVDKIVDDLSDVLEGQADAIRARIAQDTALRMDTAARVLDEAAIATEGSSADVAAAQAALLGATQQLPQLPNGTGNVTDLRSLRGYQQGIAGDVRTVADDAITAIDEAIVTLRDLEAECTDCPEGLLASSDALRKELADAKTRIRIISEDTTPDRLEEANLLVEYAIEDLERIGAEFGNATLATVAIGTGIGAAAEPLERTSHELLLASARLEYARDLLRGNPVDAVAFATPLDTVVDGVARVDDRLSFAYPYLLILVIMFIGTLLASTLIVTDKTSRASFRTFTTPVSDAHATLAAFLTGALILAAETIAILILSAPFVAQPLLNDPLSTVLVLAAAILLFTALGMIIGYLSRTQEAAMIACLSIGSVLLFVSNLVIPIEALATVTRALAAVNPYIALSELLKRSMLYGVSAAQVLRELTWTFIALVVLLCAAAWIQNSLKRRHFRQDVGLLATQHVPAPLRLGDRIVHDPAELMDALDHMARAEFELLVTAEDNPIARWANDELRQSRLARGLRTRSKERMILRIDAWLKKHGKTLNR